MFKLTTERILRDRNTPFWLLASAVFLVLVLPRLVTEGMFLDGLLYAVIARNMALGIGSFWKPHLTATMSPEFFADHPPLGMAIESVFFRLFGDHLWVESLYSLTTAVITALLIVRIWKLFTRDDRSLGQLAWLPIALWFVTPLVSWSYSYNMLENTLGLFTLGSSLVLLSALARNGNLYSAAPGAAVLITGGLFCKGVLALFPVVIIPIWWLVHRDRDLKQVLFATGALVLAVVVLVTAILTIDAARENVSRYLNTQLLPSVSGVRGGGNRFRIVKKLAEELAPALAVALVVLAVGRARGRPTGGGTLKRSLLFVLIGLSASLPLVASPRQSGFYIAPSFPLFALGLAFLCAPTVASLVGSMRTNSLGHRVFSGLAVATTLGVLVYSATLAGSVGRDEIIIRDVKAISAHIEPGSTVSVCPSWAQQWLIPGYFARYHRVSLDWQDHGHEFLVLDQHACAELPMDDFDEVDLDLTALRLFRRR